MAADEQGTVVPPEHRETARRRFALLVLFAIPGISLASWVTRTPAIRDQLDATTGQMGLVLFGLSIGSMTGVISAATFVRRYGTRRVAAVSMLLMIAGLAVIGLAAFLASAVVAFLGLLLFGLGMGAGEIAVNIDGAEVERLQGRPLLPTLHGTFSLGTVAGALLGIWFTAVDFPVAVHLAGVAGLCATAAVLAVRAVPAGFGQRPPAATRGLRAASRRQWEVWRDSRILLIGVVALAIALAEGAANDWLPLLMVDGHGFDPKSGSLVYTGFVAAMTVGRFCGSVVVRRFGRVAVVRASASLGAVGLATVVFVDNPVVAACAVVVWGLGVSLGFPLAISAAGDGGGDATARVSAVATAGYVAFLVGPPLLGFLGDHVGLRDAMIVVLVLVVCALFAAGATRPPAEDDDGVGHASAGTRTG
ncbi:MFS transporter [Actinoalloteichus caeruleus]|uniref:MFS transporter n=1 Tax=Actinoalloteichus cyanogriseus TaxID=2893586 RepID=UPI000689ABEA|nr:MFS transporter [Actinoalloteichus caeruleus]